ncbi:MAG TPA: AAA family ATPase [Acidobacteriota bacterium]|nr:AAA family ATPase [Acidobacteriota bacterium]
MGPMVTKASKKVSEDDVKKLMFTYQSDQQEVSQLETENKMLRETIAQLQTELVKFQQPALMMCEIVEVFEVNKHAIIKVPNGNQFFVNISIGCEQLAAGDTVLCEQKNLTVIKKMAAMKKFDIERFVIIEKPHASWSLIGGLDKQINEIKEVIELPLQKPELFKKVGIEPPKGVLLYGPPGTGKTMLAKAVAASTNSTFIEIVGSELVQKFIGEGAKLVKEVFQLARERGPAIIFIDEIDALAAKRIELGTSGEREVQRTFMQFLAEIDGFKRLDNVKIIGATNRKDILDPAILRPGRLDRHIHVPPPTIEGIKQVFGIHTQNMKLEKDVDIDRLAKLMEGFSGAEVKSACTEAGYFAIRQDKFKVAQRDFIDAVDKVKNSEEFKENQQYLAMYG